MRNLNIKQKERLSEKLLKAPMTYRELLEICHTTKSLMNFLNWIYENGGGRNPKNYPFSRPVLVQDRESPGYVNNPAFYYDNGIITIWNFAHIGKGIPKENMEFHNLVPTDFIYIE